MTAAARAGTGTAAPGDDGSPRASAGAVLTRLHEAFSTVEVVRAAERTGVAAFLARAGAASADEVAAACGLAPVQTGRLLTALAELGVLAPCPPDRFRPLVDLTPWSAVMAGPWASLEACLRSGRPAVNADTAAGAAELYPAVVPRLADVFSTASASAARLLAPVTGRVLDVGAGAAPWSTALAGVEPGVRVTCLDLPQVLAETRRSVAAAGLSERFDYLPGDVFTTALPPAAYDLVLLGNVCHLFDPAINAALLRRLRPAIVPGGTLAIIDVLPPVDPAARARVALYELGLLLRTERGRVYSVEDFRAWVRGAGFHWLGAQPIDGPVDLALVTARTPDPRHEPVPAGPAEDGPDPISVMPGGRESTQMVEASVVMPGGPEQTWDFVFGDGLRRVVELSRMVVAVQQYRMRSDGTPHYTMVMRVGPFSVRGISDYVVYDRPHRTVNRVLDSPFGGTFHMGFEAVPGGTRVTERWEVEPQTRLAALVLPAVRPLLGRLLQRDLGAWAEGARRQDGSGGSSGRPPSE